MASHQCEILRGCDYNVWIREHRDLHPALTVLSSKTVLQSQFQQLCDSVRQHASTRLAKFADVGCPPAPVTPPQWPMRTHSHMLKVRTVKVRSAALLIPVKQLKSGKEHWGSAYWLEWT